MEEMKIIFPDLSTAYLFKFKKKPLKEVRAIIEKTVVNFEIYIPYEESKIDYVVGAAYSEKEIENLTLHLKRDDEELLGATIDELNFMKSVAGTECMYIKNVFSSFD